MNINLSPKEIAIANNESALLGLLLINQDAYLKIASLLSPEMFYFESNKILYNAITEVNIQSKQFDISNLIVYLEEQKDLEKVASFGMSAPEYLGFISDNAGFISEIETYVKNIIDQFKTSTLEKLLLDTYNTIKTKVFNISDLLSHLQLSLINIDISEINSSYEKIGESADKIFQQILKKQQDDIGVGLKLGFPQLDETLLGLNKGDLMILAARPAMGKTAFALNIANNVAKQGKTVLFFSLEMSNSQLVQRMLAIDSSVPISKLKIKNLDISDQKSLIHTVEDMSTW
ncbi:Replicative DNA helicase, partial [Metamycoplasma alkalescens]